MQLPLAPLNFIAIAIGMWIAIAEKRFDHAGLGGRSMPWLNHGGNYADLFLITMICRFAQPYVGQWSTKTIVLCATIGVGVSALAHMVYATTMPIPGHIIDPRYKGLKRITWGGWYHAAYFAWTVTIILLFFLSSPGAPRLYACLALTAFVPLAIIQPGWEIHRVLEGHGRIDRLGWIQAITAWALIWSVGYTQP
ncbi:MAG: hypothetical protein PHW95_03465 [Patescibacteria group bacterium]|nr:hypothetical protein [Patescibacteria group bacterium]